MPSKQIPKRKRLRLKDFDYTEAGCSYFVTICAAKRGSPLLRPTITNAIRNSIQHLQSIGVLIYCYCIMPDHLHLLISLSDSGKNLSTLMRSFKYRITASIGKRIWQKSYYDHILRPSENPADICRYILENPIRKGLTKDFDEWPYAEMLDAL